MAINIREPFTRISIKGWIFVFLLCAMPSFSLRTKKSEKKNNTMNKWTESNRVESKKQNTNMRYENVNMVKMVKMSSRK